VRIVVDYRPAVSARTGVGEYIHQVLRAFTATTGDEIVAFTSSWKGRPAAGLAAYLGARVVDRRIPVRLLNYLWHRWEWPPVDRFVGAVDVAHSSHPLLMPVRRAAQVVTIHDLFFLDHPESTSAEIRRDYPSLVAGHARRAHAVITSTQYGKQQVVSRLGVAPGAVHVCPAGAPSWMSLGSAPNLPKDGCVLFLGTLEARKNVGALLDAYVSLLNRNVSVPSLVLAGRATPSAAEWLARLAHPPLAGHVTHLGYVADDLRETLFRSARLLVIPSLDEGFGLPALEAMSAGVPVVASNRGSLPEVLGPAGALVDPTDIRALAAAIERGIKDDDWARSAAQAGLDQARRFRWADSAAALRLAYVSAVERHRAQ
jgi:glycosyltransferase involved in cell wall biosynthesis